MNGEVVETISTLDGTAYVRVADIPDIRSPKECQIVYILLIDKDRTYQVGFLFVTQHWYRIPSKQQRLLTIAALGAQCGTFNIRLARQLFADLVQPAIFTDDEKYVKRHKWRD